MADPSEPNGQSFLAVSLETLSHPRKSLRSALDAASRFATSLRTGKPEQMVPLTEAERKKLKYQLLTGRSLEKDSVGLDPSLETLLAPKLQEIYVGILKSAATEAAQAVAHGFSKGNHGYSIGEQFKPDLKKVVLDGIMQDGHFEGPGGGMRPSINDSYENALKKGKIPTAVGLDSRESFAEIVVELAAQIGTTPETGRFMDRESERTATGLKGKSFPDYILEITLDREINPAIRYSVERAISQATYSLKPEGRGHRDDKAIQVALETGQRPVGHFAGLAKASQSQKLAS